MQGTHWELDPLRRGVVHAVEQAVEDAELWCGSLTKEALFARPFGLAPVAFHLRHMARSLDRLLCYAEGRILEEGQLALLGTEMEVGPAEEVWREFREGMARAVERVRAFSPEQYSEARGIGRKRLPTTVGGLLVHCAEHTQRHAGQMVVTTKVVSADPLIAR